MLMLVVFVVFVVMVPVLGGSLRNLAEFRLPQSWALAGAVVGELWIIHVAEDTIPVLMSNMIHVSAAGLALWFLWFNRLPVGVPIAVAGVAANFAVQALNDGVMPISTSALERAGMLSTDTGVVVSSPATRLAFLGDIWAVPSDLPLSGVFSIGDVLTVLGIGLALHTITDSRLAVGPSGIESVIDLGELDAHVAGGAGDSGPNATVDVAAPWIGDEGPAVRSFDEPVEIRAECVTGEVPAVSVPTLSGAGAPRYRGLGTARLFAVDHLPQVRERIS